MLPFYSPNYQPYIYHYNFVISAASYKWSHIPCHFCSWLFLLSIMPLFIVILQRWNGHLMQHLVWMSTFDLDATHSPRGYGNVYCSQNVAFLVKAEYSPNQVQKCLEKKQGPAIFGLLWSRSGTVVRVTRCSPGLSVLHTQLHSVWMQNYMIVPVATHSSILAWRIPWTKEACRL